MLVVYLPIKMSPLTSCVLPNGSPLPYHLQTTYLFLLNYPPAPIFFPWTLRPSIVGNFTTYVLLSFAIVDLPIDMRPLTSWVLLTGPLIGWLQNCLLTTSKIHVTRTFFVHFLAFIAKGISLHHISFSLCFLVSITLIPLVLWLGCKS